MSLVADTGLLFFFFIDLKYFLFSERLNISFALFFNWFVHVFLTTLSKLFLMYYFLLIDFVNTI